jgi:hypothetical protein
MDNLHASHHKIYDLLELAISKNLLCSKAQVHLVPLYKPAFLLAILARNLQVLPATYTVAINLALSQHPHFTMLEQKWTGTEADRNDMKTLKIEQVVRVSRYNCPLFHQC